MKLKVFKIIVFFSTIVIVQEISAQSISAVSLISSDIVFLRTEVIESNHGPIHNGKVSYVITYYENNYYSLKSIIKINENIEASLDIKLTSPTGKEKIYRLEENIDLLKKDEFYDYNLEIILEETGWYKLEIGNFIETKDKFIQNIVFDKSTIYVKK